MKLYSPYQNIRADVRYPATFFYLSTKDDRVHPGHRRVRVPPSSRRPVTRFIITNTSRGVIPSALNREEDAAAPRCCGASLTLELKPK